MNLPQALDLAKQLLADRTLNSIVVEENTEGSYRLRISDRLLYLKSLRKLVEIADTYKLALRLDTDEFFLETDTS